MNPESRSFVRESGSSVSTESLDPINGSTHGSDENSNVGSGVQYETEVNERHELEEAANTLVQHSNQARIKNKMFILSLMANVEPQM